MLKISCENKQGNKNCLHQKSFDFGAKFPIYRYYESDFMLQWSARCLLLDISKECDACFYRVFALGGVVFFDRSIDFSVL